MSTAIFSLLYRFWLSCFVLCEVVWYIKAVFGGRLMKGVNTLFVMLKWREFVKIHFFFTFSDFNGFFTVNSVI